LTLQPVFDAEEVTNSHRMQKKGVLKRDYRTEHKSEKINDDIKNNAVYNLNTLIWKYRKIMRPFIIIGL